MSSLFDTGPAAAKITALAPWFGSNRMLAPLVGQELGKLDWCGVPFAGSMAEIPHIKARGLLVNDKHRHIINLARVVAERRELLQSQLEALSFHPDELRDAQERCRMWEQDEHLGFEINVGAARSYFITAWMGRSGKSGTDDEFSGELAVRFTASGGGSNVRYRSAIESLAAWGETLRRCEFSALDWREFLNKCHDRKGHGLYLDPPWPDDGDGYKHKFTERDQRELAAKLALFKTARVVVRYGDHPLIRELYPEGRWTWRRHDSRTQGNKAKAEVLIINGPSYAEAA